MAKKLITREFFPLKDGVLKEEVVSIGDEKGLSARLWTGQDLDSSQIQEDAKANENPNYQNLIIKRVKSMPSLLPSSQLGKPRRRWTEELHHRFLIALQNLGGAFVATPAKIKQLMGVSDLTYHEIQSHLQQHRMHIETARGSAVAHQHQAAYGQGWQGMAVIMVVALVPMRKLSNLKPCLNLNFTYQM